MLDITVACLGRTCWTSKDQTKARRASKYIGRGSALSSTNAYARAIGPALANCGHYTADDVVWISAEGNRRNRIAPDNAEIGLAIAARARFITDIAQDRHRDYNIGERQVEQLLLANAYCEISPRLLATPATGVTAMTLPIFVFGSNLAGRHGSAAPCSPANTAATTRRGVIRGMLSRCHSTSGRPVSHHRPCSMPSDHTSMTFLYFM